MGILQVIRTSLSLVVIAMFAAVLTLAPAGQVSALPVNTARSFVAIHSNKCMDVPYASTANYVEIKQHTCLAAHPNQQFKLVTTNVAGIYQIRPVHSNKCLDIYQASTANNTPVIQFDCKPDYPQHQKFLVTPELSQPDTYYIKPAFSSVERCLTVEGALFTNGARLVSTQCLGLGNQIWRMVNPY